MSWSLTSSMTSSPILMGLSCHSGSCRAINCQTHLSTDSCILGWCLGCGKTICPARPLGVMNDPFCSVIAESLKAVKILCGSFLTNEGKQAVAKARLQRVWIVDQGLGMTEGKGDPPCFRTGSVRCWVMPLTRPTRSPRFKPQPARSKIQGFHDLPILRVR